MAFQFFNLASPACHLQCRMNSQKQSCHEKITDQLFDYNYNFLDYIFTLLLSIDYYYLQKKVFLILFDHFATIFQ